MNTIRIRIALVALLNSGIAAADVPLTPPSPLTLGWCVEIAAEANPEIAAVAASRDAALERITPAGAWDDPRVSYEASNLPIGSFNFHSTPMSGNQFGLRQKLPFPGLLGHRREAARSASDAAQSDLHDRMVRVSGIVEVRWAMLGFSQRALDITDRNIELVRQLAEIAEVKYRVGNGLQQDVLRAQVSLTGLLDERLKREAARDAAAASLASALDLPPEVVLPTTDALADPSPLPDLEVLLASLESESPVLQAARARIEQAKQEVEATRRDGYPDVDLGVGYRLRDDVPGDPVEGQDFLSFGVTMRLPVDRSKWRARTAERNAMVRHAEASYRTALADLRASLRTFHAELVRADRESQLLEAGLIPQARQSLESSKSGYQVGRVDFLSLLDSQVRLLDAELRHQRSLADRRGAFAALEATLGEKLR